MVDNTQQTGQASMNKLAKSKCSECGGEVRRKTIAQEFEKEGVKVKLSGLRAWMCVRCGEVYFEPGGAQQVVEAVNSLFRLAFNERQHKGTLSARLCVPQ
jgi:YgiT-type zinc finger domain-containing protein